MKMIAALAALTILAACTGPTAAPSLAGMQDGRQIWSLTGLSDNDQKKMRRDVDSATQLFCATKPEIVRVSAVPSGITAAFLRWDALYLCDTARVPGAGAL